MKCCHSFLIFPSPTPPDPIPSQLFAQRMQCCRVRLCRRIQCYRNHCSTGTRISFCFLLHRGSNNCITKRPLIERFGPLLRELHSTLVPVPSDSFRQVDWSHWKDNVTRQSERFIECLLRVSWYSGRFSLHTPTHVM